MRLFSHALAGALCVSLASVSSATVLTFETGGGTPSPLPPNYGNRVGDPNTPQPSQFLYGADGGVTPNVNVYYSPLLRLGGSANPFDPTRVFGDLTDVIYRDSTGGLEPGILQVTFIADPGFQVCLHSFDIAAIYNSFSNIGEDLSMKSIKIFGAAGVLLFGLNYNPADSSPTSPTSTTVPGNVPPTHRHFDFDAMPLCSSTISIRLDLSNYITIGGSKVDRFGLDNIKISQDPPVPTPGAGTLLLFAGGLLCLRTRRRGSPVQSKSLA